jgi:hypothetical protein
MYPKEIIHRVDATMSQIRVLGEVVRVLTPLKEAMDHDHETAMGHA